MLLTTSTATAILAVAEDDYITRLRGNMQRNSKYAVQGNYNTALPLMDEILFRDWVKKNNVPFNPNDSVQDYDMRGFWSALRNGDPRAASAINPNDKQIHYPDIWKTPYNDTFSNESQWATSGAPSWKGNKLVMPNGDVVFDEEKQ